MTTRSVAHAEPRTEARSAAVLAAALLLVELVAACQSYLTTTITPLMAQDLHAQDGYGLLVAATQAAMFLTMPLGAALLSRWSASQMLTWLTPLVVVGGVLSAFAPTFALFVSGRVLAALAAGALMTVSLSALATALPAAWRRLVLAGYAMVWLVASLVGPVYAGWASSAIGWRWSLVAYLPLFLIARAVVIVRLRQLDRAQQDGRDPLGLGPAVGLATGVTLLSLVGTSVPGTVVGIAGGALVLAAAARILPAGTLVARPGRPATILLMGLLCAVYFGGHAVVAITAHDLIGRTAGDLALLLGLGGAAWSVLGMVCGRWPARDHTAYLRRVVGAAGLLAAGFAALALSLLSAASLLPATLLPSATGAWELHLVGWALTGAGMGLAYVDTLNRVLDEPTAPDGIGTHVAAQALVMAEVVGTALLATVTASALAWVLSAATERGVFAAGVYLALGMLALLLIPLAWRSEQVADLGQVGFRRRS
ncbi:MFS transporter [Ornithinimicrobium cryptoxanthini]|uniref:MFS transporter n=1 Tax=Ornithinimicrobium cryptoxanthini TaxID=2934161 RepID=A0ABY4YF33_9MICO|nr:MFS transporter [Ornithinimicrobium cryptoxanthini]USQ75180.1 MFS transporter [Ornithinimicrobium cryptoxanthini]